MLLLLGNMPILPLPAQHALAQTPGQMCADQGPSSGSFVARICITEPGEGAILSGNTMMTITVSPVSGNVPQIDRVRSYLGKGTSTSPSTTLVNDYATPYTIHIPTTHWQDGAYWLTARVYFENGFETSVSTGPRVNLTFANGVTRDLRSDESWIPKTSGDSPLTIAAVGDGAGGLPGADAVGSLVTGMNPDLFLYLGDVYNRGTYAEFFN